MQTPCGPTILQAFTIFVPDFPQGSTGLRQRNSMSFSSTRRAAGLTAGGQLNLAVGREVVQ
jgi:hypothetical protein